MLVTLSELLELIINDADILEKALKRGKTERRIIQNLKRCNQYDLLKVYKKII